MNAPKKAKESQTLSEAPSKPARTRTPTKTAKTAAKSPETPKRKPSKRKVIIHEAPDPTEAAHDNPAEALGFSNLKRISRMGRPPKLCPATHQVVITARRVLGMSDAECALLVGVTPPTITHWNERGESDEAKGIRSAYTEFLNDFRASAPFFEVVHRMNIINAAHGYPDATGKPTERRDWRASDRALEIQDRRKYGKTLRVGLDPGFDLENASREDLEAIAAGHTPPSLLTQ